LHVKTYSYRFAEEILQHPRYASAYNELLTICQDCPLPVYSDKSEKQSSKDVVQQLMNSYFLMRFRLFGWEEEPLATPDNQEDALRSDFRKTFINEDGELLTLQVEVEFGNVASSYRNYFKFQLSFSYDLTDICVLIVPSQHLCNRIDSGVSNFEKTIREIPSAKLSITVPTLVIGLFDIGVVAWDVKSIEPNLDILKKTRKEFFDEHYTIVENYINSL